MLPESTGWIPLRIRVIAKYGHKSDTAFATISPSVNT